MKLINTDNLNFSFVAASRFTLPISLFLILLSVLQVAVFGLNLGIDFRGGTLIEIRTPGESNIAEIRSKTSGLNLGDVQVQEFGASDTLLLRIEQQGGGDTAQQEAVAKVRAVLGENVEYRRVEVLGPTISEELFFDGILATFLAIGAMLIYIWMRFEWQFSVGAVIALIHDVLLTAAIFSITRLEFNLATIAAGLTIIGYSMNDTVVIFDRVRETMRRYKKLEFGKLIDIAIRGTLNRTLITSITTLLALVSLLLIGGEAIFGFALAMTLGVVFGTYSSVFIAAPLLLKFGGRPNINAQKEQAEAKS